MFNGILCLICLKNIFLPDYQKNDSRVNHMVFGFCLVLTDSSDRLCTSNLLVFVMKILGYYGNIALKL